MRSSFRGKEVRAVQVCRWTGLVRFSPYHEIPDTTTSNENEVDLVHSLDGSRAWCLHQLSSDEGPVVDGGKADVNVRDLCHIESQEAEGKGGARLAPFITNMESQKNCLQRAHPQ